MQQRVEAPIEVDARAFVERAQAGDVGAFEALYRQHVGRVYALCLRATAERSHAETLTQDAFVRAWRRLGSFRGDAAFSTWLHRVTVNVITDDWRARKRFAAPDGDDACEVEVPPAQHEREKAIDLERAIARLPERARLVFVLHDVAGATHEEIAEQLGVAPGTSKAQLSRARRLLREVLSR